MSVEPKQEKSQLEIERIHSGSLSVLGILMAIFTFLFIEYKAEGTSSLADTLLILVVLTGTSVSVCGISSIYSHLWLAKFKVKPISYLYIIPLTIITITPIAVWLFF